MHGGSVLAPLWELVGVRGHLLLEAFNDLRVFVEENLGEALARNLEILSGGETYSSVRVSETLNSLTSVLPAGFWHNLFQDIADDIPELDVLILEQNNQASGLRVERAWHMLDSSGDNVLDLRIRDGALVGQLIDGAAMLHRILQDHGIMRHLDGGAEAVVLLR